MISQWAQIGNPSCPGILEVIMDSPEGKNFGVALEEEVMCGEEGPLFSTVSENEK